MLFVAHEVLSVFMQVLHIVKLLLLSLPNIYRYFTSHIVFLLSISYFLYGIWKLCPSSQNSFNEHKLLLCSFSFLQLPWLFAFDDTELSLFLIGFKTSPYMAYSISSIRPFKNFFVVFVQRYYMISL